VASIAVRHHLALAGHEFRAEAADRFVRGFLFEMNLLRFGDHRLLDFGQVGVAFGDLRETRFHSFERPEEIDRRRASLRQDVADLRKLGTELLHGICRGF
jgi:hypothetical protein